MGFLPYPSWIYETVIAETISWWLFANSNPDHGMVLSYKGVWGHLRRLSIAPFTLLIQGGPFGNRTASLPCSIRALKTRDSPPVTISVESIYLNTGRGKNSMSLLMWLAWQHQHGTTTKTERNPGTKYSTSNLTRHTYKGEAKEMADNGPQPLRDRSWMKIIIHKQTNITISILLICRCLCSQGFRQHRQRGFFPQLIHR